MLTKHFVLGGKSVEYYTDTRCTIFGHSLSHLVAKPNMATIQFSLPILVLSLQHRRHDFIKALAAAGNVHRGMRGALGRDRTR